MHLKRKLKKYLKSFHNKIEIVKNNKRMERSSTEKPTPVGKRVFHHIHRFITIIVRVLLQWSYGVKGQSMPPIKDLTLLESATSLATKIRKRKITSVEVIKSFINRIEEVNPLLNCVVDNRFEEALAEAAEADDLIESGKYTEEELERTKPFLGVPISTKDCISVKGLLHSGGLYARRNIRASEDSDVIALMRNAGAIPLCLTNVSEVCMWWESSNTVHGRTRNPYDSNRIVGGSSGGEGCIQGAAASAFGIGSDIGGSIRMPAFFNGVFGHKPSMNIVSNKGQFPMPCSAEQTSFLGIGPICRYAADLKPVLKIIAADKAKLLRLDEPVDLSTVKFFYQTDDQGGYLISPVDADLKSALAKVVKHLKNSLKADPQELRMKEFKQSAGIWFANMKDDSGKLFDHQLANLKGRINPWLELAKWFVGTSRHTFIGIMTALVDKYQTAHGTPKYHHMVQKRDRLRTYLKDLLGENGVFIYPTHPTVAPYHNEPIFRGLNFSYTAIINCLGFPATAVPLGLGSEGLPLGVQIVANHNNDRLCLAVASELERAFGGWTAPAIEA